MRLNGMYEGDITKTQIQSLRIVREGEKPSFTSSINLNGLSLSAIAFLNTSPKML